MALTQCGLKGVCIFLEFSALCTFGSLRIAQGQEWHLGIVSPQKVPVGQQHLCPCGVSRQGLLICMSGTLTGGSGTPGWGEGRALQHVGTMDEQNLNYCY